MRRGFSIIELIISMVILAIIIYASIAIFINVGIKGVNVEVFTTAQSLAEDKVEEAMTRTFASLSDESETAFSDDLVNFTYEIIVDYVSGEALDVPVGSPTEYKKISVVIRHAQLGKPVSLEAVRADY